MPSHSRRSQPPRPGPLFRMPETSTGTGFVTCRPQRLSGGLSNPLAAGAFSRPFDFVHQPLPAGFGPQQSPPGGACSTLLKKEPGAWQKKSPSIMSSRFSAKHPKLLWTLSGKAYPNKTSWPRQAIPSPCSTRTCTSMRAKSSSSWACRVRANPPSCAC